MMKRLILGCSVLLFLFTMSSKADTSSNKKVRLVYFVPSDRHPRESQVLALRELLKEAHRFFANHMEKHGFGRKTFNFEYDDQGDPKVHEIRGEFKERYYSHSQVDTPEYLIWREIVPHFDDLRHVFFVAMDSSVNTLGDGVGGLGALSFFTNKRHVFAHVSSDPLDLSLGGFALRHRDITDGEQSIGGFAVIPAVNIGSHQLGTTLHELGHVFGLEHDQREPGETNYIVGMGRRNRLSECSAEWLSIHNFLNPEQTYDSDAGRIDLVQVELLTKDLVRFRFEVTDGDGLQQAQLLVPKVLESTEWAGWGTI